MPGALHIHNGNFCLHMTHRPLIAVFRGGYSGESVISHQSAERMMAAVDVARFDPRFITVGRDGWTCEDRGGRSLPFDRGTLACDDGQGMRRFQAALIAIHGAPGEDGRLQGFLEMLGVPCQTGDVLNMALTFSKYSTTAMLRAAGFRVAASIRVHADEPDARDRIMRTVGLPCFIKPDQSGSSLGISKVKDADALGEAMRLAFAEGGSLMAEALAKGRELTCGVVPWQGRPTALPVCEVRTSHEFFDYQAKYHAQDTQELIPAPIPDEVTAMVQRRSEAIYRALECRGMIRVDHFWDPDMQGEDALVTIEVNTVPGFTKASILPKMLEAAAISADQLINGVIEDLLSRR